MFHQLLERAEAGDQMGALLRGVKKGDARRGQILAKSGSINTYNNFDAKVKKFGNLKSTGIMLFS